MINYFLSILFFTISFTEYIDSPKNENRIVNAQSLQTFFEELVQESHLVVKFSNKTCSCLSACELRNFEYSLINTEGFLEKERG